MINTYDDKIDTVTQVVRDWFIKRIRNIPDFKEDQIYESTFQITEKTPLPCVAFNRNQIELYKGKDICAGRIKLSFEFVVCYFTKPTTYEYFTPTLYHFEEKVLMDTLKLIQLDNLPTHTEYPDLDEAITIEDIRFKSSSIRSILTSGTNINWGNMARLNYQVDFSIDLINL